MWRGCQRAGVSIVCRNEEAFFWWSKIVGLFTQAGFSSEQIHLQQLSKKGLENAISGKQVTTIIVDGKIEQTEEILKRLYNHRFDEKSMVHVLCPDDSPHVEDFEQMLRSFAECRSFAVNTMRHGAPLELDL